MANHRQSEGGKLSDIAEMDVRKYLQPWFVRVTLAFTCRIYDKYDHVVVFIAQIDGFVLIQSFYFMLVGDWAAINLLNDNEFLLAAKE